MDLSGITCGFALTGSFCTFRKVLPQIAALRASGAEVIPIMSTFAAHADTRFGAATDFQEEISEICNRKIITTIEEAEPIGPKKLLDILVVAPCTGNTIAKLACGVADTPVTLGVKAHLRNARPCVIAVSTNDGLAGAAKNIGLLLNIKNMYFVPFGQDDPDGKPTSLVAHMEKIVPTVKAALLGRQLQPILQ